MNENDQEKSERVAGGVDAFPWKVTDGGVVILPRNNADKLDLPLSIRDLLGRPFRVLEKGAIRTMEFVAGRVTFVVDENGTIDSIEIEPREKSVDG